MDEVLLDKLEFYGKRWFARISLALAIFLMVPTVAIMATWNTLPGDPAYPVKRYLESIALKLVGNNFTARADLQSQFVDQRFNEAETLLSESSSPAGLSDLVLQIQASKTDIVVAKTKTGSKDAVAAQQKSAKLVTQLKEYNQKLEATKLVVHETTTPPAATSTTTPKPSVAPTIATSPTPRAANPAAPTPTPVILATPTPPSTGSTPVATTNVVTIEAAQQQIAQVIIELEESEEKNPVENDNRGSTNGKSGRDDNNGGGKNN